MLYVFKEYFVKQYVRTYIYIQKGIHIVRTF